MTHTITPTGPSVEAAPEAAIPPRPTDILMKLIVAFIAPMFLGVSGGDIRFARLAATETVNAYRLRNQADLLTVAQIIAFGLAALSSASLSMGDDLSLSMTLRLRGNANALHRAAEQNRRALTQSQASAPIPHRTTPAIEPEHLPTIAKDDDQTHAEPLLNVAAARQLAAEAQARLRDPNQTTADHAPIPPPAPTAPPVMTTEKRHQEMWAIAMTHEASEISATIPNLPPTERRAASIRAAALTRAANELLTGNNPPPIQGIPTIPLDPL